MALYTGGRLNNSFEVLADVKRVSLEHRTYLARDFTPYSARARIENDRSAFSLFDELSRRRLEIRFMHSKPFPLQPACLLSIAQSSLVRSD